MPRRGKLDLAKIHASLNATCSHSGASITPEEQKRVDWEHLQCPKCGELFVPGSPEGMKKKKAHESRRRIIRSKSLWRLLCQCAVATLGVFSESISSG